ncbi:MAG TPA: HAMP domain-containing sensor histidine kinase [Candidatus Limnocylindria bacterium]|nr:HAMP domain-containing sensor histidine kinase [Candidatus Limnocylindria bacterium]
MTSPAPPGDPAATRAASARPWRGVLLAIVGLLAGMALIGAVGIFINRGITSQVEEALAYDVELEDNADDFRVSVLDVRHYHRDLLFNDPTAARVREWEERYAAMVAQIDELAELGVRDPQAPQPNDLRAVASEYHDAFRPAIAAFETDRRRFEAASLEGLERIDRLNAAAEQLDRLGEQLAAEALRQIQEATGNASLVLLTVLAGLVAVGALLGLVVLRLVEETGRLAERERQAALALAEVSQAKTDFIADVSHELRTPLTVLRGNAEVGLAVRDDAEHGDILREIVDEASRMTKMVEDLLFLARSDAASVPLELQELEADPLLEEVAARAVTLARERGAVLEAHIQPVGRARLDPARISQAVLILVDNAAKYAGRGPVRLRARPDGDRAVITVADEGPGIGADQLPRIFERFNRGGRRGPTSGAGLGLSIARTIVEGHGGTIEAHSQPGSGTTMTIRLPLARSPA